MNRIIEIIMKRDNMALEDAQCLFDDAKDEAEDVLSEGDLERVEDIISDYFGLEPDYVFDLIGY
jgi:hypothetical protein